MANLQSRFCVFCWILVTIIGQSFGATLPIGEAIEVTADRLKAQQIKDGAMRGSWPDEANYTGSIVAGMVSAYELTCDSAYRSSAELGGDYILYAAEGGFYGDEAFALTRLSEIADDPCDNDWRTAVEDFYFNVEHDVDGTEGYIAQFMGTIPATAVFYLANYVLGAYYVDAEDKQIWREALIDYLAEVDNPYYLYDFPVMGLSVATWALALTGPLDDTLIDRFETGAAYWSGKKLEDLPSLLLSHQIPSGQEYAGSFYWRFDHTDGGGGSEAAGYTEDTIFANLGFIAASEANPALDYDSAIVNAREALLVGVQGDGEVYEHLWDQGEIYYTYAGEMLQVLGELIISGDLELDGVVNYIDYAIFAENWRAPDCTACSWCNGADLDHSGEVNFADLRILVDNWLEGTSD